MMSPLSAVPPDERKGLRLSGGLQSIQEATPPKKGGIAARFLGSSGKANPRSRRQNNRVAWATHHSHTPWICLRRDSDWPNL